MNRLDDLKKQRKHLVIYLMAGDPDIKSTEKLIYLLNKTGVSVIELGIPFSDPIADGVAIQQAGERALKNRINLEKVLLLVKKVREKVKIPIVFMTYYNLIFNYGIKKFVDDAINSGVDGAIIPDLPFDEEKELYNYAKNKGFYLIYLVAPTNSIERAKKIVEKSMGFVYYILVKGVTGMRKELPVDVKLLNHLKQNSGKPFFAGFGISNVSQIRDILKYFDGIIVGSAFVKILEKFSRDKKKMFEKAETFLNKFIKEVKNFEKKEKSKK